MNKSIEYEQNNCTDIHARTQRGEGQAFHCIGFYQQYSSFRALSWTDVVVSQVDCLFRCCI